MKVHVKSVHGVQTFPCHICVKKFNRKSNLNKHLKNIHGINVQPAVNAPVVQATAPAIELPSTPSWGDTVGDEDLIQALEDFEGKKLYYYYKT